MTPSLRTDAQEQHELLRRLDAMHRGSEHEQGERACRLHPAHF